MTLNEIFRTPALVLLASMFVGTAWAQETAAPVVDAPVVDAADLSMGAAPGGSLDGMKTPETAAVGETYVAARFELWEQRCIKTEDGADPCQLYQMLKDATGNPVAEVSMFALPAGQQAVAGASIVAPLETLLTKNLIIAIDGSDTKTYPFNFCAQIGCVARVGFTQAEVEALRKGAKAVLTIVPAAAPDQTVSLDLSLNGFTAGFEAVAKTLPVN
jgi:invasion protein IalB